MSGNEVSISWIKIKQYVRHQPTCSFYDCQQYSDGLDGKPVDCSCGLLDLVFMDVDDNNEKNIKKRADAATSAPTPNPIKGKGAQDGAKTTA